MKKVNKNIFLAIVVIMVFSIVYINDKEDINNIAIKDNALLYEEAKFYGIDIDTDDIQLDAENIDFKDDMYAEEVMFWGLHQYN